MDTRCAFLLLSVIGTIYCRCVFECAPDNDDQYCGTNGMTYDNKCRMDAAICESGGTIKQKHGGPCGMKRDPALEKRYRFGEQEVLKPGYCPQVEPSETECPPPESLQTACLLDNDCTDAQKCCSDGCNLICMSIPPGHQ